MDFIGQSQPLKINPVAFAQASTSITVPAFVRALRVLVPRSSCAAVATLRKITARG
jgi:hypothetical protein